MKKATVAFLIVIFMFSTLFYGCSKSKNEDKNKVDKKTIVFATFYDDDEQGNVYKEIAKAYEKKEGNKVDIITNFSDDKIKEALSGKNGIDLIGLRRDQIIEFSKAGYITEMSKFIGEKGLKDKLYGVSLAYGSYNGKTYGIGDMPLTMEWFYNIDMLEKYGIKEPKTSDELISASKKLKAKDIIPVGIGGMDGWTLAILLGGIASQTADMSEITAGYGGDAEAFEEVKGINDAFVQFGKLVANAIPENNSSINYKQSVEDFINGKTAFLPATSATINLIEKEKPSKLNYDVLKTPISFTSEPITKVSASAGQVLAIPANTKKNKDVEKFLEFLFSEEAQKIITKNGYMSSVVEGNNSENEVKEKVAEHLSMTNDNSIFLIDNLEPEMAKNTIQILQDIHEGRVKASEAWKKILRLTFK